MPHRYHFISGLPRSGSTLLAAILRQNPRFHAGMTSPVGGLFNNLISQVSAGSELAPMVDTETRKRLLAGLFESYYAGLADEVEVVFDTNRGWTAALPSLVELFPDAKVLCCVRDLGWVMDSLERQYRRNTFENTRLFNTPSERATVYTRVDALAQPDRLVGYAHAALREACYGEHAERLLLIDYEFLTRRPREVVQLIYQFLDEPPFEHDFDNVDYDAEEFDAVLGVRGLHRVKPKVQPQTRETILPPDLHQRFQQQTFWRDLQGSRAHIITASGG
jgi:sulfotransferase